MSSANGGWYVLELSSIHEALEAELERLENLVDEVQQAGEEAARTENAYKVKAAREQLGIRANAIGRPKAITVDEVEANVMARCEHEHLAYLIAANRLTSAREAVKVGIARVDALRSLAASFR